MTFDFDKNYVLSTAKDLLSTDSPSGFTHNIMNTIRQWTNALGYSFELTEKGGGIITIDGEDNSKTIALAAHVDTLGAMVRSISSSGNLKFTLIGGPIVPTLDSEYCKIYTRSGKIYSGTFICSSASAHVHKDSGIASRTTETLEVRLDEKVNNKSDVEALGISNGDFICIDPKTTVINDFIKSRFLDDKASVAILFGVIEWMKRVAIKPKFKTKLLISNFEEVGHGASFIPDDISEILAVDMGCIGEDLSCSEYDVSICAKDSSGPYDYHMTSQLIELAKLNQLNFAVDIYPYYGSDVGAALRGGHNIKGALIGPGVHASHGMERTHYSAMENTMKLISLYLTSNN